MSKNIHLVPTPVPPAVPELALPPDLERAIETMRPFRYLGSSPDDPGLVIDGAAPRFHPDAERYAKAAEEMLKPAPRPVIERWLVKLAMGLANRPANETHYVGWLSAAILACGNLPAGVWRDEVVAEALRQIDYWPSVARLYEKLEPHARRLQRTAAALRAMANAPPDPPPEPVRPPVPPAPMAEVPRPSVFTPQAPVRSVEEQIAALGFKPGQVVVVRSVPVDGEAEFRSWFAE